MGATCRLCKPAHNALLDWTTDSTKVHARQTHALRMPVTDSSLSYRYTLPRKTCGNPRFRLSTLFREPVPRRVRPIGLLTISSKQVH